MSRSLLQRLRHSLKYRIAAIIFLLEAAMMAAVLGVTITYSQRETEKQLSANEEVMLQLLGDLSRIALLTSEYDELQPYIEQVVRDPHIDTVLLADRRGRVVVSNRHEAIGRGLPTFEHTPTLRWLVRDIENPNGRIGTLAIRFSHESLIQINRQVRNLGVSIALTGMTVIAIVGILIGYLLTRRLDALSRAAQRLAGGDLAVRTGLSGHDEVAIVGRAFDTMARSVAENVEALKRATDLLEQRVAERTRELAEARDEAIAATRSKSAFLANMSHEIRTPLTAIIGFSETLLDSNQSLAERVDAIRTITRSGKHLLRIINDILDVSKMEANRLDVERIPLSPFELLDDVHAIVALLAEEKALAFEIEYRYPLPARIVSDPLRLKQILINLCNNAIKFTARGGVRIRLSWERAQSRLLFEVIDSGIGMTEELIRTLFRAFTQADASTTREYGGTGLGLYLSRELATRLGGEIAVQSTPGAGSVFTLAVPTGDVLDADLAWERPVEPAVAPAVTAAGVVVDGEVLLAEDNVDNQKLVTFLLRSAGASVTIAENGQRAVELGRSRRFDLVLMDLQMPVMGGLEATRELRREGYHGPVVALTANAMRSDIDTCLAAGCDDFMSKPIQKDKLHELLLRYLLPSGQPRDDGAPILSTLLAHEPTLIDLVSEFVARLPGAARDLRRAHENGDADALKRSVHSLKGSAGNFGYGGLFKLCQLIEFEIAKDHAQGIARLLDEMDAMVERIRQGLQDGSPVARKANER
ncbi:chemotaxis protein CheY [Sulfurifustis variabilis]|uniref:histidine kinase n=1 Tax=Sulfurifustis variabilis TaxID=1675686 RepID=A0A1B4V201_9GAMM|nr:ATP-binding protein [Sulfurifustis variabilis]BAU47538.1 chemotaxis protein CheY [Sulfurifustis variabilis]